MSRMQEITNHLEFLNYKVNQHSEGILKAEHNEQPCFLFADTGSGVIFSIAFRLRDKARKHRQEFLELLNTFNTASTITWAFTYKDAMFLRAFYPGAYDKTTFASFIEGINKHNFALLTGAPDMQWYIE